MPHVPRRARARRRCPRSRRVVGAAGRVLERSIRSGIGHRVALAAAEPPAAELPPLPPEPALLPPLPPRPAPALAIGGGRSSPPEQAKSVMTAAESTAPNTDATVFVSRGFRRWATEICRSNTKGLLFGRARVGVPPVLDHGVCVLSLEGVTVISSSSHGRWHRTCRAPLDIRRARRGRSSTDVGLEGAVRCPCTSPARGPARYVPPRAELHRRLTRRVTRRQYCHIGPVRGRAVPKYLY